MSSTEPLSLEIRTHESAAEAHDNEFILANEGRNLFTLAVHHIVLRVAWIFKTESVIMPAFVDVIAGAGWLRGCLPILNRFGQSVPAMVFADRLLRIHRKKWALLTTTLLMAVPFVILSALWLFLEQKRHAWLPPLFLVLYFAFFSLTGLTQLSFGTLQGKLIRPNRRGKLLGVSGIFGAVLAILCAWALLRHWLALPDGGFGYIFGFTGTGFALAGLICLQIREPADHYDSDQRHATNHFRFAWQIVRQDAAFRRFATVTVLFVTAQLLFPHYQALGLGQPGASRIDLMTWVIAQNAGMGVFSILMGAVADRFGNRLTIRLQIFIAALTPPLAVWLARGVANPAQVYWIAFVLLGIVPVAFKTLVNYTLEISAPDQHPRYISTLKFCMVVPFCLSPVVGLLVDILGFEVVFVSIAALIAIGGVLTFRLSEPRHQFE